MSKFLRAAHLNLTMDCNFRCNYCFVAHNPSTMNLSTALNAIDFLDRVGLPDHKVTVDFFGGEPLLNWDVLTKTVAYADSFPKRFHFGLVTNGTLLDEEKITFLAKHDFGVLASYDGRMSHDRMRSNGTSQLVEANIKKMLAAGIRVSSAMTLTPGETQHMFENFMSINALGVINIAINPVTEGYRPYDEVDFGNISEQYDKLLPALIDDRVNNRGRIRCSLLDKHLPGIKQKATKQYKPRDTWACGACRGSLGVWPNGEIMPCHEMTPAEFPDWLIGNVNDKTFDEEKRCEYTRETYRDCDQCEVTNCGHCRVRSFRTTGDEEAKIEQGCRYQRLLYEKAIKLWNGLVQAGVDISKVG